MSEHVDDDVRRAIALIVDDPYVNGMREDVRAHRRWRRIFDPVPPKIRRDESWDRYVYFFYRGEEGVAASSGFRYTANRWIPHLPTKTTGNEVWSLLEHNRAASDPRIDGVWNAAAISYDRSSGATDFHRFYGSDAERWQLNLDTQPAIAEAGLALFG